MYFANLHIGEHIVAAKIPVDMNVTTAASDLLLKRAIKYQYQSPKKSDLF